MSTPSATRSMHWHNFLFLATLLPIASTAGILHSSGSDSAGSERQCPIGVGTHLSDGQRDITRTLDLIHSAGIRRIRDDATWAQAELRKGELRIPDHWDALVDEAHERNIQVLWILAYSNPYYDSGMKPTSEASRAAFSRYAKFVAKHFRGRVSQYQVWNEWELNTGGSDPGTAEDYAALLRSVYPAVKEVDPSAEIIVSSVGSRGIRDGYVRQLVAQRVLDYSDSLSLHTYVHCDGRDSSPDSWARWITSLHGDLSVWSGLPISFYITEMGWPSSSGPCGVSEAQQAEYLFQLVQLSKDMPFIKGLWWYDFQNDGPNPNEREHNFGLVTQQFEPKAAYHVAKDVCSW